MKRKNAMSAMGYAICFVIVLGIIMIVSAPMIVNNTKKDAPNTPSSNNEEPSSYINLADELRRVEESLSSRIDQLESAASSGSSTESSETLKNKYICTEDKSPEGQLEPVDGEPRKIIFVCEYKE